MNPFVTALAVAALSGPSVVEFERSYAALAQEQGQWTAFRATAAPDAVLFVPNPVRANDWLAGRSDPPVAVKWQPALAFLSCDGRTAVTSGPWQRPASTGYFVTVWSRFGNSWRWNVDFGDALEKPLPDAPSDVPVRKASCRPAPGRLQRPSVGVEAGSGESYDKSLSWTWSAAKDGGKRLEVDLWNGKTYDAVLNKTIAVSD